MNISDFIKGIITTLLSSILISIIAFSLKPIRKKVLEIWEYYKIMKATGLKLFLPDSKFAPLQLFDQMIDSGKHGDEILIVGRTLRWIVEQNEDDVLGGIKKGLNFKFLILNPQKVEKDHSVIKPLQLGDHQTISKDLGISIPLFRHICEVAKEQSYPGSFEVRVVDFLIINSLTTLSSKDKRQVILDFSFRESRTSKYQQYYESDPNLKTQFANRLYNFYQGIYQQSECYIHYHQGRITRGQSLTQTIMKEEIVEKIIQKNSAYEAIRKNNPSFILHRTPKLFDSIRGEKVPPYPISVQIELTNQCNTFCKHCLRHSWPKTQEMSTERIKSVLDELASIRVQSVTFSGGEPTIRQDFPEILEYADSKGLKAGILTNGLDINRDMANIMTRYSSWVRVSLDASDPATYPKVRGVKGGFDQVVNSLRNLVSESNHNENRCRIGVCYTIQKMNIEKAEDFIEFAQQENLIGGEKAITLKFVHGRNGFLCDREQLYQFYQNTLCKPNPVWEKLTNLGYLKSFIDNYSNLEDIADGIPLNSYLRNNPVRCFTPYLFSLIDACGDVYPCCFLYHDNESYDPLNQRRGMYRMGSLARASFQSIWFGDDYTRIRRDLDTVNVERFPECRECTRHYLHNIFLTELYNDYQEFLKDATDAEERILRQYLRDYASDVIWL